MLTQNIKQVEDHGLQRHEHRAEHDDEQQEEAA